MISAGSIASGIIGIVGTAAKGEVNKVYLLSSIAEAQVFLATAMKRKRGVRNRWVEVVPADTVPFLDISPLLVRSHLVEFGGVRSPPLLFLMMGSWSALELGKKLVPRKIQKLLLGFVLKV